ncbi:ribonuclease TTHA0252 [Candidatus Velamenicoccus archaeovorus]|uniref:Ribonuclease TTHA0252 n=1 Tax=Velamenicoccus archaeovorus TaxID=1930593 RepID=A0A410P2W3_VELA1|nr:MBL fold metallo-hydrolase [Candidatus Velamenicoccus archaeovorus]QAT16486.1 ribonuclease TTHA0252 [Candidatus Velamenicoccus archaeovorus]
MKKNKCVWPQVRLKFLGGVRTVTGSSHLLTTPKSQVLIDAGLFYGHRDEFYKVNTTFSCHLSKVSAVALSHAHIDHCGNIPTLLKHGLRSKIYTTSATRDLCKQMLADSARVQEEDFRYLRKIGRGSGGRGPRNAPPFRGPLYTEREALRALGKFRPLHYGQRFQVTHDVTLTFYDAGHILGASVILIEVRMGRKAVRLGYAVDLGRKNLPMLNDPTVLRDLDYLVLESTYGGRMHAPISEAKEKLRETITKTVARKGKIIIPAFALERTQEVLYYISELLKERAIPEIPIYVDSPLATRITEVFRNNVHYMDPKAKNMIRKEHSPFDFVHLHYVQGQEESKSLNNDKRPMIILAGSGMCEAGRVLHHLKNNITESRNTVLVVGYMAKNTLGKRIVDRERMVRIYGLEYELNAEVVVINALSGHADSNDLLHYAQECSPFKKVFLVHGDEEQTKSLYDRLCEYNLNPYMPQKDEEVVLYEE